MAFNQLTDEQAELLDLLAEECAEVIQAVSKIKRHGWASVNPLHPECGDNRTQLERELGHAKAAISMLMVRGELMGSAIESARFRKLHDVQAYLHHVTLR